MELLLVAVVTNGFALGTALSLLLAGAFLLADRRGDRRTDRSRGDYGAGGRGGAEQHVR